MLHKRLTTLSTKALLLLTLLSSTLLAGCKTQEVQSSWSATPVKIDGEMNDWTNTPMVYFEDSGVQLGLRNDSENLYVLFRFNNQSWARAIRMGGVTLWLDNSGKKNKDFGIRYAGGPSISGMQKGEMQSRGGFWDSLTPEQQQRLTDMQTEAAHQVIVINKKSDQERAISADGSSGPAVSFGSDQSIYTYEFSIPFQKSDLSHYGIGVQPGKAICVGLEWGGMSKEDRASMMERMGGRPPGGMGSRPPGEGPHGGGRGGRPGGGSRPQAPEKQELWIKTKLALPSSE
jgi:hypothetical protein